MWVLPSRGRPEQCQEMLRNMSRVGMVEPGILYVHEDDPCHDAYAALHLPPGWVMETVPAGIVGCAEALRLSVSRHPLERWYGFVCDDHVFVSQGFERRLVNTAGDWGIASTFDPEQPKRITGAVVFGGEFIRALGYIVPDGLTHLYADDVWETLGRELRNWRIIPDITIEHAWNPSHPTTAAANRDYDGSRAVYQRWLAGSAAADIMRVRMAMWDAQGISLSRARQRSVMFGFPVYDSVCPQHEKSAMDTAYLLAQLGIRCAHAHSIGKPIHQSRNAIAEAFLASGMSDLIMIDADMSWCPWDVVKLLACEHPLVAGVGRKRNDLPDTDPEAWCFSPIEASSIPVDAQGFCEVAQVGTGFMRVHRSVFEALRDAHPEWTRRKGNGGQYTAFFRWETDGQDEISEDIMFCRDWRKLGGRIMIDPRVELGHYGPQDFRGRLSALFVGE